ncbi:hypothetical protein K439DRAFT_1348950 [Ramaria rubella]|nr:hypothetical protein K439DRAFT_1348950 [Ramaria rubella]
MDKAGAKNILCSADEWVLHLAPRSTLSSRFYHVIANFVPIDFDPQSELVRVSLYGQNTGIIEQPSNIVAVKWLHNQRAGSQTKRHSSLVITLNDPRVADELIDKGVSINDAICDVKKYNPPPMQCFRCQQFRHTAAACPHKSDPAYIKCACCVGNHPTKECMCTHSMKCTDI